TSNSRAPYHSPTLLPFYPFLPWLKIQTPENTERTEGPGKPILNLHPLTTVRTHMECAWLATALKISVARPVRKPNSRAPYHSPTLLPFYPFLPWLKIQTTEYTERTEALGKPILNLHPLTT